MLTQSRQFITTRMLLLTCILGNQLGREDLFTHITRFTGLVLVFLPTKVGSLSIKPTNRPQVAALIGHSRRFL